MKTKTPRTKPLIIASSVALLGGLTRAAVSVPSDLGNAVQTIQRVIFAEPNGSATNEIELKADSSNGQVQIKGKVLATPKGNTSNILWNDATNSQLYYGQSNNLNGSDSAILYGESNLIKSDFSVGIWGKENKTFENSSQLLLIWGKYAQINWENSAIIGGQRNTIQGNKNLILHGEQKSVSGNQNYAFGSYVIIWNNNQQINDTFVWSDALRRRNNLLKFSPTASNTFLIRSENGVGINTNNPIGKGITVNGMVQLGEDQNLRCNADTVGAMRLSGSCFEACEKIGNNLAWRKISKTADCGYEGAKNPNPGNWNNPGNWGEWENWGEWGNSGQPENPPVPNPVNGVCGAEKYTCSSGKLDPKSKGENNTHFQWRCAGEHNGQSSSLCESVKPKQPAQTCAIGLSGSYINGNVISVPAEGLDYHEDESHYKIVKKSGKKVRVTPLEKPWKRADENHLFAGSLLFYRWKTGERAATLGLDIPSDWQGSYTIKLENLGDNDQVLCEKTYTVRKGDISSEWPTTHNYWYLKEMPNWSVNVIDFDNNPQKDVLFLSGENWRIFDSPNISEEWSRGPYNSSLDHLRDKTILKILQDYLNKDASQDQWQSPTWTLASMFDLSSGYAQCSLRKYYGREYDSGCSMLKPDYVHDKRGNVFWDCSEPWKKLEIPIILRKFEWIQWERGYGYKATNIHEEWSTVKFECKEVL